MALPTIPLQFPDMGNALLSGVQAGYYAQRSRHDRADEQRRADAQQYIEPAMKGDSAAMGKLAAGDSKTALAITSALQRMDANQRAKLKEQTEYSSQAASAILQASPAERAQIYRDLHAEGIRRGYDMSTMPPDYTPAIDGRLRSIRQMSIPVLEQFKQDEMNRRHNSPGGGGGVPTQIDLPTGGAPIPTPAPVPQGKPVASAAPPDVVQNTQIAGSPTGPLGDIGGGPQVAQASGGVTAIPETFSQGAPQSPGPRPGQVVMPPEQGGAPQGPKREGLFFQEDPTKHGYSLQRHVKDRYGNTTPMTVEGHFVFVNPQTKEVAYYKPQAKPEKPVASAGPFAGNSVEAQALNMLVNNGTLSPQQAAELAAGKTITNPADGSIVFMTPSGVFKKDAPAGAAPPPGGGAAPGAPSPTGNISVTPGKIPESFKKLETEVTAVNSAIDNFNKVLKESGGGTFNAFINNPQDPQAQKVLGAFNALKTALRSEAFVNTGVLQPAEMTMLDNMLLAPTTVRGLFATPEAYAAMLDQIKQFVAGKMGAARGAYGVAPKAAPAGGADLKKKYGLE